MRGTARGERISSGLPPTAADEEISRIGSSVPKEDVREILRRAQGRVPKGSGASSRQPAVLPTYGIGVGGIYGLGFGSSPHRGKHQQTSRTCFRLTRSQFGC